MNRVIWTDEMVAKLTELRARNVPLYWCAHEIGVGYQVAVYKARELGLAKRRNKGRRSGDLQRTVIDREQAT